MYRSEIQAMLRAPLECLPEDPTSEDIQLAKRNRLILSLLWDTWARKEELRLVDIEDVDLQERQILLRHTKRKVRRVQGGETRSDVEERYTSFSPDTRLLLLDYLGSRRTGPLLTTTVGKRIGDLYEK